MPREAYNPIALNAKTGFVRLYECTTCWVLVGIERTEEHAAWHDAKDEGTQHNGRSNEEQREGANSETADERQGVEGQRGGGTGGRKPVHRS